MNRLEQKSDLLVKLGRLFGPLFRLIEAPSEYDQQEKAETLARYFAECPKLQQEFRTFTTGQPGHDYVIEFNKFYDALDSIRYLSFNDKPLEAILPARFAVAKAAIDAVPVPATSVILEAGSPFTAYCRLRELCEADATASLVWLDPYVDASVFHRYLASARPTIPVTLVTSEPGPKARTKDKARWAGFLDVSRLYAGERGPNLYTLVNQPNLHDRWAVFDDKRIYAFGGSAKDAADKDYFTITSVDATPTNLQRIKSHISGGVEYFGNSSPTHR